MVLMTIISEKSVRYQRTTESSETDPISYNYDVENEYSIIKHSGKVALQRVPDRNVFLCSLVSIKHLKAHYKVKKFFNFSRNLSFECLWRFDLLNPVLQSFFRIFYIYLAKKLL